ncbi:MAG: hypothetical protein GY795_40290 [Desulfobacterales bacterium]|nr:hypothetical protein [Desulfobacterales bacterium]
MRTDYNRVIKLAEKLGCRYWRFRRSAAEKLGKTGDPGAVQPLTRALKDVNDSVRRTAAEAMGNLGYSDVLQPLVNALEDKNEGVRNSVADALKKTGDPGAVKMLAKVLKNGKNGNEHTCYCAADILKSMHAITPLAEALNDDSLLTREIAAETLGKAGDPLAVKSLVNALDDKNKNVRCKIVEALGNRQPRGSTTAYKCS